MEASAGLFLHRCFNLGNGCEAEFQRLINKKGSLFWKP
jgi:hypothetical protein